MPFSARNARYLRISAHTVIPLYIYLDDRHVEWMSDYILQRVLADLKPNIGPKLHMESNMYGASNSKKGALDVHTGDTYKFAYFFRKNEPHAVLIKNRTFVPAPEPVPANAPLTEDNLPSRKKRKRDTAGKSGKVKGGLKKSSRTRQTSASESEDDSRTVNIEQDEISLTGTEGARPRRSGRTKTLVAGGYKDVEVLEESGDVDMTGPELNLEDNYTPDQDNDVGTPSQAGELEAGPVDLEDPEYSLSQEPGPQFSQLLDVDADEEEKPKMALRVSYQGFTIYDRCLCVVIEPWPPLRAPSQAPSRASSLAFGGMRMSSVAPMDGHRQTPIPLRERTPLFLPDIDPRRSLTPAPLPSRILPPVPLFDDPTELQAEDEESDGGVMAFSQVLKSLGDERAGSADEDGDEGDVFLGDADERKGGP